MDYPFNVGPQTDGTNLIADSAIIPRPEDTAGGLPAQYDQGILDIFKFGISTWADQQQSDRLFEYKRFEATNGGVYQQGRNAAMPRAASGGTSPMIMIGLGLIVVVALMAHKG